METKQVLNLMKIISWIVFIGLCIKVGAILITTAISMFSNPEAAENLYLGLDLSNLLDFSTRYYIYIISFIIVIASLQAYMCWLLILALKKVNISHPFTTEIARIISKIAYFALSIGINALAADSFSKWIWKKSARFEMDWGSKEFLLMAGILYVISFIFKRGVELQQENDLTI